MNFFKDYVSNTYAGTCNNSMLNFAQEKTVTGKIYYKVIKSGNFDYRFFFSNNVHSTFSDGSNSKANDKGEKFEILSAYAGVAREINEYENLTPLTFSGKTSKTVGEGEEYWSDEINLNINDNEYLVFQWTVKGTKMAYTPDKIIPAFVFENGKFTESPDFPQPIFAGCKRAVKKNIVFIGDSITQGLGTENDKYDYWVAQIGKGLGADFSVWDVGLGYGRAADAATDKVWLKLAKTGDIASVCFGVNDILQLSNEKKLKEDLTTIVESLKKAGCTVSIFTVPPFDFEDEQKTIWQNTNKYIREELSKKADIFFDIAAVLGDKPPFENKAPYGGHPDKNGCKIAANAFLKEITL